MSDFKKYIAEFIGTCVLVTVACGVAVATHCGGDGGVPALIATALAFGLVIVAMAYSIGNISGCHINPAVSLAMLISKKMSLKDFIGYVIAQILGALLGAALVGLMCGSFAKTLALPDMPIEINNPVYGAFGANTVSDMIVNSYGKTGALFVGLIAEIALTFVFVLAILGVTSKTENKGVTGIVIGLSLTLVHLLGITITGTSVNPARSFGPAVMSAICGDTEALQQIWIFIIGPLAGGALAAFAYTCLAGKDKKAPAGNIADTADNDAGNDAANSAAE